MKLRRYALAFAGLLVDWLAGYVVLGVVMCFLFPFPGHEITLGLGWRFWPGAIGGLLAGLYHFRIIVGKSPQPD